MSVAAENIAAAAMAAAAASSGDVKILNEEEASDTEVDQDSEKPALTESRSEEKVKAGSKEWRKQIRNSPNMSRKGSRLKNRADVSLRSPSQSSRRNSVTSSASDVSGAARSDAAASGTEHERTSRASDRRFRTSVSAEDDGEAPQLTRSSDSTTQKNRVCWTYGALPFFYRYSLLTFISAYPLLPSLPNRLRSI
jgi:Ni/Co efflux regulator RcnB